jgi:hypothetical protein
MRTITLRIICTEHIDLPYRLKTNRIGDGLPIPYLSVSPCSALITPILIDQIGW